MRYGKVYAAVDEDDEPIACAYFMRDINEIGTAYLMSVAVLPVFPRQGSRYRAFKIRFWQPAAPSA